MNVFNGLAGKAKLGLSDFKTYWKYPKEGNYVSYKEWLYFTIGASGNNSAGAFMGYIGFAASCLLVGTIYGISFKDIYLMGLIGMPLGYIMGPINMIVTDNLGDVPKKSAKLINAVCIPMTIIGFILYFVPQQYFEKIMPAFPQIVATMLVFNGISVYYKVFVYKKLSPKFGKYRPWIIVGILPSIIMVFLIVFLPFKEMIYYNRLWILHFCFSIYGMFSGYTNQLGNLHNVISPNSEERAKIMSIGALAYSTIPSVVNILFPVFAMMTGGLSSIRTYRTIIPFGIVAFSAFTLFLAFGIKDKVIISKGHQAKVSFATGFRAVLKNKYFWITNLSGLGNCISSGSVSIINILFIFTTRQDWWLGLYSGIIGTAYIPGLVLAPWFIKKFGKKDLILGSKLIGLLSVLATYFSIKTGNVIMFIVVNYVAQLLVSPAGTAGSAMTADIWDYQQYKTGERLDGCAGIFGLILTPIATLGGMIIPKIYANLGFTTDWDIMYVPQFRNKIVAVTFLIAAAATVLTAIPYFFYDLTEEKHKEIIKILRQRAEEEDYNSGLLANESIT